MEGYINNGDVNIHYTMNLNPKSTLTLLFIPGGMMPLWVWEKQLSYFSNKYTVIAMDPRSQGNSSQSSEGQYAEGRASDIDALIEQLDLTNVVLIGWSLAVSEIVVYIHLFGSKKIRGIVLVDGLVGLDTSNPLFVAMKHYWLEVQKHRLEKTKEFIEGMFKQPQPVKFKADLVTEALKLPTTTMVSIVFNLILNDYRSLLPSINIPSFIVGCKGEREEQMQEMKHLIPNSQLLMIGNAGHALFIDQPEVFNKSVDEFIISL